ncbi:cytochrome P450 9e2 [Armadillidium vulgare]|nr:cytochrome P450 9e2 [Armadillidium vulgare]
MLAIFGTFLVFIFTLLFAYNWQKQQFWKSKGVHTPSFLPFLGHLHILWKSCRWETIDKSYQSFRHHGLYGMYSFWTPELYVFDPEILRLVLVKDSDHFIDRRDIKLTSKEKFFKEMLTMVKGEKWKALRSVMTPTFTSGKIKSMFPLIGDKVNELVTECEEEMRKHSFVDMKSMFSYYTTDVIGTCAFGIDANCLKSKDASQFIVSANYLSNLDFKRLVKFAFVMLLPRFSEAIGLSLANKHMDFFKNVVEETVDLRIKSGQKRGDFLDILLDALEESKMQGESSKYPMTMNTITAESILFLLAGFDTTSNTLSFLIYLLAANKDAQRILREELQEIIEKDGEFNYQNIMEARYLDACLSGINRLLFP